MATACISVCVLWAAIWCWGKRLNGMWAFIFPCILLPLLAALNLDFNQLRSLIIVALLTTTVMLFSVQLRYYVLLPSTLVLVSGIMALTR